MRIPSDITPRLVVDRVRRNWSPVDLNLERDGNDVAERTLVVASHDRSGSTLLSEALIDTGRLGVAEEYLQLDRLEWGRRRFGVPRAGAAERRRNVVRRATLRSGWFRLADPEPGSLRPYLEEVVAHRSRGGVFAIDLHWQSYRQAVEAHGFDLGWLPGPIDYVWLRRDPVASAVSLVRARQSKVWRARRPGVASGSLLGEVRTPRPVHYDDALLVRVHRELADAIVGWGRLFVERDLSPVTVTYRELDEAWEPTMARLLAALVDDPPAVPEPALRRLADDLNERWAAEFRRRHPAEVAEVEAEIAEVVARVTSRHRRSSAPPDAAGG